MTFYHEANINTRQVRPVNAAPIVHHLDDDRRRALVRLRPEWAFDIWEKNIKGEFVIGNEMISKLIIKARRQEIESTLPQALDKFVR